MDFLPELEALLPLTAALLRTAHFTIHEGVVQVILGGSRGLRGGYHPDSDVDLTLVVGSADLPDREPEREQFLRSVVQTSLDHWRGAVELDTAAVFDTGDGRGLRLFDLREYDAQIIGQGVPDSLGLYKIQKGFNGYVPTAILDFRLVYPLLTIWRRSPRPE